MDVNMKLSVIMPLYNVQETISIALESVLMQKVNFDYEIIAVNDGSTDNTINILTSYAKKYRNIRIINNGRNCGNAESFYVGLKNAKGEYFCVLDGDDYYTISDKLIRQVQFLDDDRNLEYSCVAHKYIRIDKEGNIYKNELSNTRTDYTYAELIKSKFYFHTSTYMFRNVFRNNVPEIFRKDIARGDTFRVFYHCKFYKGKIKILNFVGSVYNYNNNGIWSKLSIEEQYTRNKNIVNFMKSQVDSSVEKDILSKRMHNLKLKKNFVFQKKYSIDDYMEEIHTYTKHLAFKNKDFMFAQTYKSKLIDSICETIGFIARIKNKLLPLQTIQVDQQIIAFVCNSNLSSKSGGVFYEIVDIIRCYTNHTIYIVLTDADSIDALDEGLKVILSSFKNVKLLYGGGLKQGRIQNLIKKIIEIKPAKIYHYLGNSGVLGGCLVQPNLGKNINVFSFDHGLSLGLDITTFDCYITKRPLDYYMLKSLYKDKVTFIPAFNHDFCGANRYVPFRDHNKLVTCCVAARFYKIDSKSDIKYPFFVSEILKITKGTHIHFGPLPDEVLSEIKINISKIGLPTNSFIYKPWTDNLQKAFYENNIDLFIEPYSVVSYKITLDALCAGIPTIVKTGKTRLSLCDFIYNNHLSWDKFEDLLEILSNLDSKTLKNHSKKSRDYFIKNHSFAACSSYLTDEKMPYVPDNFFAYDNRVIDVENVVDLANYDVFNDNIFIQGKFSFNDINIVNSLKKDNYFFKINKKIFCKIKYSDLVTDKRHLYKMYSLELIRRRIIKNSDCDNIYILC